MVYQKRPPQVPPKKKNPLHFMKDFGTCGGLFGGDHCQTVETIGPHKGPLGTYYCHAKIYRLQLVPNIKLSHCDRH